MATTTYNAPAASNEANGKTDKPRRRISEAGTYSLGSPAADLYEHYSKGRENVINTARDLAKITIPSVFPPEGYEPGDNINESNQSVGALCVNTLASKLMLMALPPDRPVFRFIPVEHRLQQQIQQGATLWSMVQDALSRLEIEHRNRMEATTIRSSYVGATKHLLIAGNVCWEHLDLDTPVYHAMNKYVVKRNSKGQQLFVIVEEEVEVMDLDVDHQEIIYASNKEMKENHKEWENRVTIHRICKRIRDENDPSGYAWAYWEEFEGEMLPGTEFTADYVAPPLYAAWMIPVYGKNWGRSYCEEYRGDLIKTEEYSASLGDGAALASLVLLFLNPGSRTSAKAIRESENMQLHSGKADDITMFKSEKAQDFAFVNTQLEVVIKRLGRAFLLVSSVQRQAERVTAEEWQLMAKEIDEAMGGTYSGHAQSFQRQAVNRFVVLHNEDDKQLPKLPPGVFRVAVITGIEALGRSIEGASLVRAVGTAMNLGKEEAGRRIDWDDFMRRIMTSEGVKTDGLLKTAQAVQQEEQQMKQDMMKRTLLEKGAGPAVTAIGKGGQSAMEAAMAAQQGAQGDQQDPGAQEPQAPQQ